MESTTDAHTDTDIRRFYDLKNIAVVGMSAKDGKPAHFVPKYLIDIGYNVIPVNPTIPEVLGRKSYPNITDIPEVVDIVDIFRKSEDIPPVIDDAIKKKGVQVIWMQLGIYNEEAERKARERGISVVFNRCMMEEHRRLFGN